MNEPQKKKNRLPPVLLLRKTHIACFLYFFLFLFVFIYYSINNKEINIYFLIPTILFGVSQYYLLFKGKKIILTDKKIYVYIRGKKSLSLPLQGGFTYIGYKQNRLGKIFNYGTLSILTQENMLFNYFFLNDCVLVYEKILEQHVNVMKTLDPDYKMSYKEEDKENSELIDKIEESNNS